MSEKPESPKGPEASGGESPEAIVVRLPRIVLRPTGSIQAGGNLRPGLESLDGFPFPGLDGFGDIRQF
jgi:hypothetical protein